VGGSFLDRANIVSLLVASTEENEYLVWFNCRTAVKLPGSFVSDFWTTVLLQTSLGEPEVLHTVLALSSIHRGGMLNGDRQEQSNSIPDKLEQFTLKHYIKAINYLRSHFLAKDIASFWVTLIAFIVPSS
jgi:hypothetical protein